MARKKNAASPRSDKDSLSYINLQSDDIDDKEGYYFDRIHINYESDIDKLRAELPINDLKKECRELLLKKSTPRLLGYKTLIQVIAPTKRFLQVIAQHYQEHLTPHIVTYIEIAHDVFYPSKHDAECTSYKLFRTIRKKYSWGNIFYGEDIFADDDSEIDIAAKNRSIKKWRRKYIEQGLFARQTFYSVFEAVKEGTKKSWFKFVIYARFSKINWKPCVHYEWRIKSAEKIRDRTGIRRIHDLLKFDFKKFFEAMEEKYIVHEQLDKLKIGSVLVGLERRRKLTKRQLIRVGVAFDHFASYFGIGSVSDFRWAVSKEHRYLGRIRGPKSDWAEKINKFYRYTGSYVVPL